MFSASKTAAPVSSGYQIANSLRFRSSASAYLSRTPGSAGNQKTWTWSGWVKLGSLSNSNIFVAGTTTGNRFQIGYDSNGFTVGENNGAWVIDLLTTAVYRDPSAWYHLVVSVDTTQATSTNRVIVYVNSVAQTLTGTFPSQNLSTTTNSTVEHDIGQSKGAGGAFFDGYLADINFIDGQALTPSSFGQINPTTGVWQPIKYAGTYGTNGFHLAFNNGTSTTTLGYDSSGNGNNWTPNNISLTAGSTYDWMLDSPTPYAGSSYGVGNYAVLNPLQAYNFNTSSALSNGNLTATQSSNYGSALGSIAVSSGKWYCEITFATDGTNNVSLGFIQSPISSLTANYASYPVVYAAIYPSGSSSGVYKNWAIVQSGLSNYSSGVLGIALDLDSLTCQFYVNGTAYGSQITGLTSTGYVSYVFNNASNGTSTSSINHGQRPFAYTPPSGYKSLCTYNLPTPTIQNGAGYMAATIWTGTGANQSIVNTVNGVSFQPDFVWLKSRGATYISNNHNLFDVVRGANKDLFTDLTNAEVTYTDRLNSFDTNGYTVGTGYNSSGGTFVGWQWKAGGTAVTNTAGSITSQVSANTTSGFSVVTYTGTGVNATVGHGLGVAPSFIIFKKRNGAVNWGIYHISLGNQYVMQFDTAAAYGPSSSYFNSTSPSSTVISVGTLGNVNDSGGTYVAYCFAAIAGYSAFGSYTGNGSADGPFVFLGFRPRFVLVKSSTAVTAWLIWDTSRNTYNLMDTTLFPNSLAADYVDSTVSIDALSNGFKIRGNSASQNGNGSTYIYAAFAESPFSLSLAR